MADRGRVRVETSAKRVRVMLAGVPVADTAQPRLVWEKPYYPTYYLPEADVRTDLLVDTGESHHSPSRGDARVLTVKVGDREAPSAARWYAESPIPELAGTVRLDWGAMDAWFEEDEEVFVHPRDPHTRVDILQSSRHVRVEVDGETVADSHQPRLLFETGLPPRYYLPKTDVRMDLLTPTDSTSRCPSCTYSLPPARAGIARIPSPKTRFRAVGVKPSAVAGAIRSSPCSVSTISFPSASIAYPTPPRSTDHRTAPVSKSTARNSGRGGMSWRP